MNNLGFYRVLARLPLVKSYAAKFALIALFCTHIPLTLMILLGGPHGGPPPSGGGPPIAGLVIHALVTILFSAIIIVIALNSLLSPVNLCTQALRDYMDHGVLPNLPTHYKDQAGMLMADLQNSLLRLDRSLKEQEQLAITDGLTGLKNHRTFQEHLQEEVARTERYQSPLSVLILDVDYFKCYNDSFGHPAGDEVLRKVAEILQVTARKSDVVARYGGEEFAVILPENDAAAARQSAERFRAAIEAAPWTRKAVTVSIGLATWTLAACRRDFVSPG